MLTETFIKQWGSAMKKILLSVFLFFVYSVQLLLFYIFSPVLSFLEDAAPLRSSFYLLIALILLTVVLIVINIAAAFSESGRSHNAKKSSLGIIMGFKLALIPFFICHVFWFILMMGATANPFLFVLWLVIPFIFIFYSYMVLLATSSYSIVQIYRMGKAGTLAKGQCVFHIIMQLLFFADVIDAVYLFFKYRKSV